MLNTGKQEYEKKFYQFFFIATIYLFCSSSYSSTQHIELNIEVIIHKSSNTWNKDRMIYQ